MKYIYFVISAFILLFVSNTAFSQEVYQYETKDVKFVFFDKNISHWVPHLIREHSSGLRRHDALWGDADSLLRVRYRPEQTFMFLTDWNDDGNGGVNVIPNNLILVGLAPLANAYDCAPSTERYRHLFSHELTHIYMTDKATRGDMAWRKFFGAKVPTDSDSPITALWSYLSTPRWYNPRWYQEGIACFLETAMDGGVGRALGTYDEMYFRTQYYESKKLYSVVGLETEGTSADFQVGATSYLYGTRFVNYLAYKYGPESLFSFYNRTTGSKPFYANQFKKVYGLPLRQAWKEWTEYEKDHHKENLDAIAQYPLTSLTPLFKKAMGSVCKPIYDPQRERLYLAANYQGYFAHISYIDLKTGKEKILSKVDGPTLYYTTYLTYDSLRHRLIFNIHNGDFRGIQAIDADSGKTLKRLILQRVSNLTYDNVNDCMYGIMSNGGINHIIRYSADLEDRDLLYSFAFGQSVSDLTISSKGDYLLAQLTKPNGNNTIIRFSIKGLSEADLRYEEVMEIDNVSLNNFSFAQSDSTLIGSSNYTGVSNIWSIDLATKDMKLLTNVPTGIYCPIEYKKDSLIALNYEADGLRPVKFEKKELEDASAITLLGQKAFDNFPQLRDLSQIDTVAREDFAEIYNNITTYKPIKEIRFAGAFPEISGFRDVQSFNHVTPVLGYRLLFKDPVGLNSISLILGVSPWSHNDLKKQFHAELNWKIWNWNFSAAYNPTSFYDLFGPRQRSRSGYNVGFSYSRAYSFLSPLKWNWSVGASHYGMMEALPLFQEISSPVESMQVAQASVGVSKMRTTLGGVTPESGYSFGLSGYSYFAALDGKYNAFPSVQAKAEGGFLLPIGRHNTFWIRTAAGQSFGSTSSSFGYEYFGGFKNNYVDNSEVLRYREVNTFPGAKIDEISAHSFAKFTGEICFTPIRLKNVGFTGFYPNYMMFSLFSSDLIANPWGSEKMQNYINVGAQLNIEMVLFSYLKTTWSVGYAYMFYPDGRRGKELMLSLKLL